MGNRVSGLPWKIISGIPRKSGTDSPRESIGPISVRRCAEPMATQIQGQGRTLSAWD